MLLQNFTYLKYYRNSVKHFLKYMSLLLFPRDVLHPYGSCLKNFLFPALKDDSQETKLSVSLATHSARKLFEAVQLPKNL